MSLGRCCRCATPASKWRTDRVHAFLFYLEKGPQLKSAEPSEIEQSHAAQDVPSLGWLLANTLIDLSTAQLVMHQRQVSRPLLCQVSLYCILFNESAYDLGV